MRSVLLICSLFVSLSFLSNRSFAATSSDTKHYDLHEYMACKGFFEEDKAKPNAFKYGHFGKVLISQFSQERLTRLWASPILWENSDGNSYEDICPEYQYFDQKNRVNLWAYILSHIAFFESSCHDKIQNPNAPNGTAQGLFQLFKGHEGSVYFTDKKGVAHETKRSKNCKVGDSSNGDRSLTCTLSMLEDQMARGEVLFSNNSYWAVLRPDQFAKDVKKSKKNHKKLPINNAAFIIKSVTSNMCKIMAEASSK